MNGHQEFGEVAQLVCTIVGIGVLLTIFIIGSVKVIQYLIDADKVMHKEVHC